MKIPQLTKRVSGQVVADTTTYETKLVSDWMLAAGGATLAAAGEMQGIDPEGGSGTFGGNLRFRYAAVSTERPGVWDTTLGTANTTAGEFVNSWTISGTTDQLWVQVAFVGKYTTAKVECFASLQGSVQGTGTVVATEVVEVTPVANSGTAVYVEVGKRWPLLGATKVMLGVVFTGVSGTITWRPVGRQFASNVESPGAWGDLGASALTRSTDGDFNTGQLTMSPTAGYLYGQLGVKFSGDARGTMKITAVVIY